MLEPWEFDSLGEVGGVVQGLLGRKVPEIVGRQVWDWPRLAIVAVLEHDTAKVIGNLVSRGLSRHLPAGYGRAELPIARRYHTALFAAPVSAPSLAPSTHPIPPVALLNTFRIPVSKNGSLFSPLVSPANSRNTGPPAL